MKSYLELLRGLTGRMVDANDLCSLEEVVAMREDRQKNSAGPVSSYKTKFLDLKSDKFCNFVDELEKRNHSPIFIWTAQTIDCGALCLSSINNISSNFT